MNCSEIKRCQQQNKRVLKGSQTRKPDSLIHITKRWDNQWACALIWDLQVDKFDSGHNVVTQVKFKRTCRESSEHNWANISETICPTKPVFGK